MIRFTDCHWVDMQMYVPEERDTLTLSPLQEAASASPDTPWENERGVREENRTAAELKLHQHTAHQCLKNKLHIQFNSDNKKAQVSRSYLFVLTLEFWPVQSSPRHPLTDRTGTAFHAPSARPEFDVANTNCFMMMHNQHKSHNVSAHERRQIHP